MHTRRLHRHGAGSGRAGRCHDAQRAGCAQVVRSGRRRGGGRVALGDDLPPARALARRISRPRAQRGQVLQERRQEDGDRLLLRRDERITAAVHRAGRADAPGVKGARVVQRGARPHHHGVHVPLRHVAATAVARAARVPHVGGRAQARHRLAGPQRSRRPLHAVGARVRRHAAVRARRAGAAVRRAGHHRGLRGGQPGAPLAALHGEVDLRRPLH